MLSGFGRYVMFIGSLFVRRESFYTYYKLILEECIQIGVKSSLLFILVSTFIGAVTTIQTAFNMTNPFVPKFMISLVVREMTILELAPSVMALIYAGKIGSSMAGGLGTMRITEQIDALEVMGINAASYLVLPKIIASMLMFPMLVILSNICSMFGGYLVSELLNIITPSEYNSGLQFGFKDWEVMVSITKAITFAFLTSSISSFKGFYTRGGALEVGMATTDAVTTSVICILFADYLIVDLML